MKHCARVAMLMATLLVGLVATAAPASAANPVQLSLGDSWDRPGSVPLTAATFRGCTTRCKQELRLLAVRQPQARPGMRASWSW